MVFHRTRGAAEGFGDFAVRVALDDEGQHILFAAGQAEGVVAGSGLSAAPGARQGAGYT